MHPDLQYLYNLNRLGIKVGLQHTRDLLSVNNNPEKKINTIHIAGTNGKGSTCSMINSILLHKGLKVGIYTSPHLIRFNERIKVNNEEINDEYIISFLKKNKKNIEKIKSTFFETTTVMAFSYFQHKKVDVAIIETGLGGRLDSTNVLKPKITAITSISLDHRKILGETIKEISKEKSGIIKKNTPLVVSNQPRSAQLEIDKKAKKMKVSPIIINNPKSININIDSTSFKYDDHLFSTPLIGEHQALNASIAIEVCKQFLDSVSNEEINFGLKNTLWPGRLQLLKTSPIIYYDVAHNSAGIRSTIKSLKDIYKLKPIGLMVFKGDKEGDLIANSLKLNFENLIVTGARQYGLLNGKELGNILLANGFNNFEAIDCFDLAISTFVNLARKKNIPGIIFGSHYISELVFNKFGIFH